ncbi:MAG: Peptidase [Verrucomicrobia bacterium]|nr:Peptidase [Verrucomicrobiota bacterium]
MHFPTSSLVLSVVLALPVFCVQAAAAALSKEEAQIVAFADAQSGKFAADLESAVQIDSSTENLPGVRQMAEFFLPKLTALGFECRYVEQPPSTHRAGHLVAVRRGTHGKRLLLIGHLDTVLPGGNWRREGTAVHGSGVADIKGGDLILIHALQALDSIKALEGTQLTVIFSGDEESAGTPLEVSRKELRDAAARSDVALAYESAVGMTGTVARRGSIAWELEAQGPTGHSSGIFSAPVGSGAVFETARILGSFYEELRKLDGVTVNPAMIAGGREADLSKTGGTLSGKANIIAQRVMVRGDLRTVSAEQLADAQAKMQEIVSRHLPRTSATLKFEEGYPAMSPTPENYALLAQLNQVSLDLGHGEITAFDPRGRGAGDIAFVSPPLAGLDGLGLGGTGEHSIAEAADLADAPNLIKRSALLIYRLTR